MAKKEFWLRQDGTPVQVLWSWLREYPAAWVFLGPVSSGIRNSNFAAGSADYQSDCPGRSYPGMFKS